MNVMGTSWLTEFAASAEKTDRFVSNKNHTALLAVGLLGETGSVLSELKKEERERSAYPVYRRRMLEEFGDFLWYFVRLVSVLDRPFLNELEVTAGSGPPMEAPRSLPRFLELGHGVGDLLADIKAGRVKPHKEAKKLYEKWL